MSPSLFLSPPLVLVSLPRSLSACFSSSFLPRFPQPLYLSHNVNLSLSLSLSLRPVATTFQLRVPTLPPSNRACFIPLQRSPRIVRFPLFFHRTRVVGILPLFSSFYSVVSSLYRITILFLSSFFLIRFLFVLFVSRCRVFFFFFCFFVFFYPLLAVKELALFEPRNSGSPFVFPDVLSLFSEFRSHAVLRVEKSDRFCVSAVAHLLASSVSVPYKTVRTPGFYLLFFLIYLLIILDEN